jgi:hypothetical protein
MGQELVGLLVELGERGGPTADWEKLALLGVLMAAPVVLEWRVPGGPIAGQGAAWGWGSKGRCGSGVD